MANRFFTRMFNRQPFLKPLLFLVVFLLFSACSQYQFVTLESDLNKDEHQAYIYENDTAIITYAFKGRNCPINISVYNKTETPLYIDWHKSAVIVRGERISYWADEATISGRVSGIDVNYNQGFSTTDATLSGKMYRDEQVSFIPPNSFVKYVPLRLKSSFFDLGKNNSTEKVTLPGYNGQVTGKNYQFNKEYSPFTFRSYLTLFTGSESKEIFHTDHEFWVSNITETHQGPSSVNLGYDNMYYVESITNQSMLGCGFLGIGAIAATLFVLNQIDPIEEHPNMN